MHPVLFELPWGGSVNAYGTLIFIGIVATFRGIWWDAKQRGIGGNELLSFFVDFYLAVALGAFLGGRLLHVLTVPSEYIANPMRVFVANGTGFVFFGSLAAIVAGWAWVAKRHGTTFSTVCDLAATWMALGHAFGRLGCLFAGCCWGAPTDAAFGLQFGPESVVVLTEGAPMDPAHGDHTVPLVPIQVIEAGGLLLIAAVLATIRIRRGPEAPWRQASRYAIAYGALRFVTDAMRGDESRGFVFELPGGALAQLLGMAPTQPMLLSVSQLVALGLVVAGIAGLRSHRPAAVP
jgi:phosphatidylglycerol:prolipoprotein diacylglycerol transferase